MLSDFWYVNEKHYNIEGCNTSYYYGDLNQNDSVSIFVNYELNVSFEQHKISVSGVSIGRVTVVSEGICHVITCLYIELHQQISKCFYCR